MTNGLVAKSSHSRSASPRPSNRMATPIKNSAKKPVPASFNDLLKRAAQNKLAADPLAARTADARTRAQPSSYPRSASPVGKSLLDRTHQKARGGPLPPSKIKVTPPPPTSSMRESTKASKRDTSMSVGKSGAAVGGRQAGRKTRKGSLISPSDLTRRPLKDPGKRAPSPSSHRKGEQVGSESDNKVGGGGGGGIKYWVLSFYDTDEIDWSAEPHFNGVFWCALL